VGMCVSHLILIPSHSIIFCAMFDIIQSVLAVVGSEPLNDFCAAHWEKFATAPYFDAHGVFMSIFFSSGFIFVGFILLIALVIQASKLLVAVKRTEIEKKSTDKKKR
jgi:hypothetical protein